MRVSEILASRVTLTLATVVFVGLVWSVVASRGDGEETPAPPHAARSAFQQIDRPVVATGRIRSVQADSTGDGDTVALVVPGVGSFRIADSGKGRELKQHVGDTVRVVATTRLGPHRREVLDVEDYSVAGP